MISKYLDKATKVLMMSAMVTSVVAPTAFAQGMGAAISGPVDIQAQEQEFAEDHVVAKGSVRVRYKDSIINAPQAILYKDATGNLKSAVFTGHPSLVQSNSKLDADTITFEMANQKVLAEGNAHSEVISEPAKDGAKKDGTAAAGKAVDFGQVGTAKTDAKPAAGSDKIVTDSDRQEYDKNSGKFIAIGHVRVKNGDITARADKLQLMYGQDNRPETAIFTGNAVATQNRNSTSADTITYFMNTKRLQATGHVKSQVIQPKKAEASKKGGPNSAAKPTVAPNIIAVAGSQPSQEDAGEEEEIVITSDSQDLSQDNGRITANGNVHVFYEDTTGVGPKIVVLRTPEGKAEKVYFVGRSQVSQPGRRWVADRITMTVATKKVLAEGNTKAYIIQDTKTPGRPQQPETQLASRTPNNQLSASKTERPL